MPLEQPHIFLCRISHICQSSSHSPLLSLGTFLVVSLYLYIKDSNWIQLWGRALFDLRSHDSMAEWVIWTLKEQESWDVSIKQHCFYFYCPFQMYSWRKIFPYPRQELSSPWLFCTLYYNKNSCSHAKSSDSVPTQILECWHSMQLPKPHNSIARLLQVEACGVIQVWEQRVSLFLSWIPPPLVPPGGIKVLKWSRQGRRKERGREALAWLVRRLMFFLMIGP